MADLPIAILGAKGMLGTDLSTCFKKHQITYSGYDLPEWDITNPDHVRKAIKNAQLVINCAAYTNVEKAETDKELAFKVNAEATGMLGQITAQNNIPVIHISTDFVFDGMLDRPYVETDPPNPISAYGASKYEGENKLIASGCRHCIVRVQWTYGRNGVNFIKKLLDVARAGKPLRVVDDQIGAPTATAEVSEVLYKLTQKQVFPEGIFHLAAAGYTSRYAMARFMFEALKMNVDLSPCKTSDFPSAAKRPLNSRFDCCKIEKTLNIKIRDWKDALKTYLEQI